jgi:hypothetical protein
MNKPAKECCPQLLPYQRRVVGAGNALYEQKHNKNERQWRNDLPFICDE